ADVSGVALGVGCGELGGGIAGACNQPGADARCLDGKAELLDRSGRQRQIVVAHTRYQQILPDREADIAITKVLCDFGKATHLFTGHLAHRQSDADPVQPRLLLGMHPDMRHPIKLRTGRNRVGWSAYQFAAKLLLDGDEELFDAHAVEHVFETRLQPVGAVADLNEHTNDGVRDLGGVLRLDDDSGFPGEILVAGNAAYAQAKPDAGLDAETVLHFDRGEGDVVGVFKHRDLAGAVESDVELARQSRQRAVVENVVVPFAGVFAGVDQFLRIDPRARRARDIADIVGARAARAQADVLDPLDT